LVRIIDRAYQKQPQNGGMFQAMSGAGRGGTNGLGGGGWRCNAGRIGGPYRHIQRNLGSSRAPERSPRGKADLPREDAGNAATRAGASN